MVKLQILNLAVKLYLTNQQQTEMLCRYIFNLARYDENYDIRDRARFLKPFIFPSNGETVLSKQAKRVFLSAKPAPSLVSQYSRDQFQLGSLAHYLNARTNGYHDLPPFPKDAPDSSVRGVEQHVNDSSNNFEPNENQEWENRSAKASNKSNKKDKFYSESENESSENSDSEESSDGESGSGGSGSENGSKNESGGDSESEDESSEESSSEGSSGEESSGSDEESESEDEIDNKHNNSKPNVNSKPTAAPAKAERSNLDLLLDLDDITPTAPIMTPSLGGFLTPISNATSLVAPNTMSRFELVGPVHVTLEKRELLSKINGHGLQINYRFTRAPHLYSAKMVSIELTFHNESNNDLENIHLSDKSSLPANVAMSEFVQIAKLSPGQCVQGVLGVDFSDSTQPLTFGIKSSAGSSKITLKSNVGEMIRAVRVTEPIFKEEQCRLRGMNEHTSKIEVQSNISIIQHGIFETANLALIANNSGSDGDLLLFSGQTMSSQSLVLVIVERKNNTNNLAITVNCEKMVIGSMLLSEIKNSIKS